MSVEKICEICGTTKGHILTPRCKFNMFLCTKHYAQLQDHGKITDHTSSTKLDRYSPNPIRKVGDVVYIGIDNNNGEIIEAMVDIECIKKIQGIKWRLSSSGYAVTTLSRKTVYMHRLIKNIPDGLVVDHKNKNKLDNTKNNLRICTPRQNSMNSKIPSNNTTGIKGVSWIARINKWRASIKIHGKFKHLGYFEDKNMAHKARLDAEHFYFGEFMPNNK